MAQWKSGSPADEAAAAAAAQKVAGNRADNDAASCCSNWQSAGPAEELQDCRQCPQLRSDRRSDPSSLTRGSRVISGGACGFLESAIRRCCCRRLCGACGCRSAVAAAAAAAAAAGGGAALLMMSGAEVGAASCKPTSLDALANRTRFSREELKLMYRGFKNECPSGVVQREAFRAIFSQFFPLGDASSYADLVFNSFDRDARGWLTFDTVIEGLSVLCKGTTMEKLEWAFRLYDADRDGGISMAEMAQLVAAIYDMLGCRVAPRVTQLDPRLHAERVFRLMDADRDGVVTFQEFVRACQLNGRDIDKELACFDTLM